MAKIYHCAVCGKELKVIRKAIPQKGIVMNLVSPHECIVADENGLEVDHPEETVQEEAKRLTEPKDKLAAAFDSFPFVGKLNKGPDIDPLPIGDRRSKQHLREEVTSTAPINILEHAKGATGAIEPGRKLEDFNGNGEKE